MKRTVSLLLFTVICILTFASCKREVRMEHCELGILLTSEFEPYDTDGTFDVAYTDGELIVGMSRVSYPAGLEDGIASTLTARAFASLYAERSGRGDEAIFDYGDCAYFSYVGAANRNIYRYTHTFYKTPYAYFVISFISSEGGVWSVEDTLKLTDRVYLINV